MDTTAIFDRVMEVLPAIRARRDEIEEGRRLPRDLVDQLCATRVFALAVPRDLGGLEADPADIMRALEILASADGSTGWCAMIAVSGNSTAGYMDVEAAREVFADPAAPTAGIAAPVGVAVRENGGFRVSGRWPFASGITHCDWMWMGCTVMENGQPRMTPMGPETVHVCVPVREVSIHDTWYVSGLRGTGSNDVSVSDLVVPAERTFALLDPRGHRSEPLYQVPPLSLFVSQLASVSLGIARGALDELTELAQAKTPSLYQTVLADKAVPQIELARREAAVGAARAFLYESVESMWRVVCQGAVPGPRQIATVRIAALHAAETAAEVTRAAATLAGGSAIYARSPLQRHARDAAAVTHHFSVAPHVWEEAGRVFLGREPIAPVF